MHQRLRRSIFRIGTNANPDKETERVMVQEELIRRIAADTKVTQPVVKAVLDELGYKIGNLKPGDEIRTAAIGTFSVSHQNGRMGRNPKTGAWVEIDPKNVVKFKAAKHIRDAINSV